MDKKIIIKCIIVFLLAFAIFVAPKNYDVTKYVAEIANKKISKEEYQIYLYEQKLFFENLGGNDIWEMDFDGQLSQTVAKERAFESLLYIKIAVMQAQKLGLLLTDAEEQMANEQALQFFESIESEGYENITFEHVQSIMEETVLFRKLYEEIIKNFTVSEVEFERYYQQYLEENKMNLDTVFAYYIFVDGDNEKFFDAYRLLQEGISFEEVAEQYSDDYNKALGLTAYEIDMAFPIEVIEAAYSLETNEISRIIQTQTGSYILKIQSKLLDNREELENKLRENYFELKRNEFYESNYQKWKEDINIKKNDAILDQISI